MKIHKEGWPLIIMSLVFALRLVILLRSTSGTVLYPGFHTSRIRNIFHMLLP